jgi:hypothetical protein
VTGRESATGILAGAPQPPVSPSADIERALATIHGLIHGLELSVADLGIPVAPLYLASARGSLRRVSACIGHDAGRHGAVGGAEEILPGSGVTLVAQADRPGVAVRARRASSGSAVPEPLAEIPSWAAAPDLGADLVGSPEAASMCGGPVGATLLFCALAHHWWMHRVTGTKWSTDASGARALVAALNDGAGCAMPLAGPAARLIDVGVVDLLESLGWSRLLSLPMPGAAST